MTTSRVTGGESPPSRVLLEARALTKSFGGVRALQGASLRVDAGNVVGLVGANGAGKSTLIKVLTGGHLPDGGELLLLGSPVCFRSEREARSAGVSVVPQELDLVPALSVMENIFLGVEGPFTARGTLSRKKMENAAAARMASVGLSVPPTAVVSDLSIGDRQLVAIARAMRPELKVLLLDEPTSSLTPHEVDSLFRVIESVKASGAGVVFITHRLDEISQVCDEVTVLRDGMSVATLPAEPSSKPAVIDAMVAGRTIEITRRQAHAPDSAATVLEFEELTAGRYGPASFKVRAGEILGLFGLVGAGRTTLMRSVVGLAPRKSGRVLLNGVSVRFRSPHEGYSSGIGFLSEDRKGESVLSRMSIIENATVRAPRGVKGPVGTINRQRQRAVMDEAKEALRIKLGSYSDPIETLSGGNQQKVVLARILAEKLTVLILDEPTHGIDVEAKADLLQHLQELADQGLAVILISSELEYLVASCDRLLVLREGKVQGEWCTDSQIDEAAVLSAAVGIS